VVSSTRLEPGAAGQIRVTVETAGRTGYLVKYITVYSNDRVRPVSTLTLSVDVGPSP
jgi:Protein of unknown function (DUF1573)